MFRSGASARSGAFTRRYRCCKFVNWPPGVDESASLQLAVSACFCSAEAAENSRTVVAANDGRPLRAIGAATNRPVTRPAAPTASLSMFLKNKSEESVCWGTVRQGKRASTNGGGGRTGKEDQVERESRRSAEDKKNKKAEETKKTNKARTRRQAQEDKKHKNKKKKRQEHEDMNTPPRTRSQEHQDKNTKTRTRTSQRTCTW